MSETKFTPGPWNRSQYGYQVLTHDSENNICELKGAKNMAEQIANASIIAAAPEMYEVVQMVEKILEEDASLISEYGVELSEDRALALELAKKALVKARGEDG